MVNLKVPLHKKQKEIFALSNKYKYVVFAKGRRFGFTHGAMLYVIASVLGGKYKKVLWGDTTHANVNRYIKRYGIPLLKQIPQDLWKWNKNENLIEFYIGDELRWIDFRSADRPENWEGFGYDLIVLNEAGIILKNRYLWENSVAPMLLDNPNSKAIIGGAPKGKNLFYELWKKAEKDPKRYVAKQYTSYDNPLLDKAEIKALEESLPPEAVRQEIYAEFIDSGAFVVIKHIPKGSPQGDIIIIGLDPAHENGDPAGFVVKKGGCIVEAKEIMASTKEELLREFMANVSPYLAAPEVHFVIERDGIGQGVFEDILRLYGELPNVYIHGVKVGGKASKDIYKNKKAELWFKGRELAEKKKLTIAENINNKLLEQINRITYEIKEDGKIQIISKKDYRATYGGSPNLADAFILTCVI